MLVFDILNEPTVQSADLLNDIMLGAHSVIRAAAPGKTIMFQSYHASKFADIDALKLPRTETSSIPGITTNPIPLPTKVTATHAKATNPIRVRLRPTWQNTWRWRKRGIRM